MKRNTMRLLSLALTLVMLLGAVPFAAAAGTATLSAYPGTTVWEGTEVDLTLDGTTSNQVWSTGHTNVDGITVTPSTTTTYSVDFTEDGELQTKSIVVAVKEKAKAATFTIEQDDAIVGEEITLTTTGAGDSNVTFSGNGVTGNKFKATSAGTYTVTAIAENDPTTASDNVTATTTIVASVASYKVTVTDKSISLNNKNTSVSYTLKKGTETVTTGITGVTYSVVSGSSVSVNSTTGVITPKADGNTTVKVTVTLADGATVSGTGTITVTSSGVVYLDQDGEACDDDSIDLEFSVVGPGKKEEVTWELSVSALNIKSSTDKSSPYFTWKDSKESDKRKLETEEDGPDFETELVAKKGHGIAMIEANAYWTNTKTPDATGVFYISFYDEIDYEVTLKDGVDEFDWDDNDVFSAAKKDSKTYTATELKSLNLAELLTLDAGTYIDLDEGKEYKDNEDVGEITANKKLTKWDSKDVNTYEMEDLEYLTFEVDDDGSFILDYVQYDKVSGYGSDLIIGEGTLEIIVGKGTGKGKKGDINYNVKNKGEVNLDEDDFEDFWDEYCDDEDVPSKDAEFGYVMFDYKATKIKGALYGEDGDKSVKNTYLYHFDYDDDEDDSSKDFDLNDMLYKASSTETNYVDEIDFTCYNEDGDEICDGTVTFTVGTGEEEEKEDTTIGAMAFSDVKSSDWYYDAVKYVYENGIMAGTSTTKFSPDTNLTRGMIVTMLYRVEGQPTATSTNKFNDVKSGDYFYDAVRWASNNGIVNGTSDTTFSPNTNITRQDLATILYRYVKEYKGQTASLGTLTGFADASQVSDYASSALKWAVGKGIVNGVGGSLLPKGNATRAQAATMFQRLLAN